MGVEQNALVIGVAFLNKSKQKTELELRYEVAFNLYWSQEGLPKR